MEKGKVREMTMAEKEKFLSKIRIETEDVPETQDPRDIFKTTVNSYIESMQEQIERLDGAIALNTYMKDTVMQLLNGEEDLPEEIDESALKTEISTRDSILVKMLESRAIMKQRLQLSAKVIEFCTNNYDDLLDVDFYFNAGIGFNETRERMERIVKNVGDTN